jgi:serine protease
MVQDSRALPWCAVALLAFALAASGAGAAVLPEYNPQRTRPVAIGPEADRLVVAFRTTPQNAVLQTIPSRPGRRRVLHVQARTSGADMVALARRAHVAFAASRQLTPSMHVLYLPSTLQGASLAAALAALRADAAVKFADIDQRRFPHAVPDDPLFTASADASGQWYMMTPPNPVTPGADASATDAVSAWSITTGSTGTVIADVDTGVRFDHPDLARAGLGGRLLPGYDFVGGDLSSKGVTLGTFLIANDGDGWDPDPSDPGDWIDTSDQANPLFPAADCPIQDSSWHGTRVMGILGALTNNAIGIAGMTWNPYLLPVRALGKCGGYDSDIITGMQWAAGLPVTGVPDNPYPADIINLSLGGSGACPSDYADVVTTLTDMGVLIVASAGNGSVAPATAAVDAPANCAGVLGVAGLRNVGTKVGYSSLGSELGVAAPAGNCINSSGACLRSIDTTSNTGLTVPADSTYTNEINPNLGTSFSAPIVAGIAALMRAVNANLSPAQLIARIESSALPFPQPAGIPVCPNTDPSSGECACPNDGSECGAGMVNALLAVESAQRPIAAVAVPASASAGTGLGTGVVLDAAGSVAACGRTIAAYSWAASGGVTLQAGTAAAPQATVTPQGTAGSITLTVTDSAGAVDTATLVVSAAGVISRAATTPESAGGSAGACPVGRAVTVAAPTVGVAFEPASVPQNAASILTLTLANSNAFGLTQSTVTATLPAGLVMMGSSPSSASGSPGTTCGGGGSTLAVTAGTVTLSGANIPAGGSCLITIPVASATAGSYTTAVAAHALTTGPAGSNAAGASAVLTVTAPSVGGGGRLDWWDTLFVVGVLLAGRRGMKRRAAPGRSPEERRPQRRR